MSHLNQQIVRLYDTVFDRAPDAEGLEFWNNATHNGFGLRDLANFFIAAPEFAATYGEPTTQGFVESLYLNILDRPGEAEGIAFWTNALNSGLADRPQVVVGFSESAEHIQQMAQPSAPPAPQPQPYQSPRSGIHSEGVINGDVGGNFILGSSGSDLIFGVGGNDTLEAGGGNDVLVGGSGSDLFVFRPGHGNDVIRDFTPEDYIMFVDIAPGQATLIAAYGPPSAPGQLSTLGGYDVVYRHGPQQGTIRLEGIDHTDLG